jgi:hypothetical protein
VYSVTVSQEERMPTMRVDDEVYRWLQSLATPFEDNPNSVLRRVAGLDTASEEPPRGKRDRAEQVSESRPNGATGRLTGKILTKRWGVNVEHALYHCDGTFYENLKKFPGALCDSDGYVMFRTEEEYLRSPYLSTGKRLNVHGGISSIPGYKRMP